METMKLSEAIRLGAMLHPQSIGSSKKTDESGQVIETCALMAAVEAVKPRDLSLWVGFLAVTSRCPEGNCPYGDADDISICVLTAHLNDHHRWSRERIADWIEAMENPLEGEKTAPELTGCSVS